jgi:methionyl-tRNA formyltransferase
MKFKKNIGFFGTGGIFSNIVLKNLFESNIPIRMVFILVKPKSNLQPLNEKFCIENDLDYTIIEDTNTSFVKNILLRHKIDLGVIASYSQILKDDILSSTKDGFINLHPSYLPYYKGANPIFWQIKNGENEFGATVHKVNNKIDEGQILNRNKWNFNNLLSGDQILKRVAEHSSYLLVKTIEDYQVNNKLIPKEIVSNNELTLGFYNPKPREDDFKVNLIKMSPDKLKVLMKRIKKWGDLYFTYNNEKLTIVDVKPINKFPSPTDLIERKGDNIRVSNQFGSFVVRTKQY